VQYSTLTRTNYNEWSLVMKVNMQAQGLWHIVEPEEEDIIEYWEDRLALAAILRVLPPEMLTSLATKRTAQSSWRSSLTGSVVKRVSEANAEHFQNEFVEICFKEGETVDDFSMCITVLTNSIAALGGTVIEVEIVKKMLHVVPEPREQVTIH
jgi:hypothetical protein